MTVSISLPMPARRGRIDLSRPIFVVLVLVLGLLVVLPLFWLGYYSFLDQNGQFTHFYVDAYAPSGWRVVDYKQVAG